MKFDKLDKSKEQAVVSAIEQIIDRSKHSPGEDLNKIAADVLSGIDGMTPALATRACEAYNKSKSVYTLQKRASEDRAEDFELVDPAAVASEMYGYHKKVAGADLLFPAPTPQQNIPELRRTLEKVAWDASEAPEAPEAPGVLERELYRTTIRLERKMEKLRENVGIRKQASEDAIHRACQVMRKMQDKALNKVAHITVNKYGDDGVRLMKLIGAYIDKELPLEKTANAALFPLREPFTSIAIAMDEAREHARAGALLKKSAAVLPTLAGGTVKGVSGLGKATKHVSDTLISDPIKKFMTLPIGSHLAQGHKKVDEEAFNAELRNRLLELRATQAFTDIASDDFIKDYPIDDSIEAFNNIVGAMPELLDEKYTAWLKSLVREQLVQGNVYDPATIKQLQDIGKEIKKGRIADIDEATKQLEAGEGGVLPGMEIPGGSSAPEKKPAKDDSATKAANKLKEREMAAKQEEAQMREARDAARDRDAQRRHEENLSQRRAELYLEENATGVPPEWAP